MKQGYHRIMLREGEVVNGPVVVETGENGKYASWHFLEGEEPQTIWIGGTYKVNE